MNKISKLAAVASCTLGAALGTAGIASATSGDGDLHPRLVAACERVPNLTLRTHRALDRLQGDASTVGSTAWLQAQIDKAQAAGRDQLVTVLENRKDVRVARITVLQKQLVSLDSIGTFCADHGIGG
jgi:hypothetical protein